MKRRTDWTTRLGEVLLFASVKRFQYGRFDCCLFVADCIHAMTGADLARELRSTYVSRPKNWRTTVARLFESAGINEIATATAKRGDPVLVRGRKNRFFMGIVDLNGRHVVAATDVGLLRVPVSMALRAWHV